MKDNIGQNLINKCFVVLLGFLWVFTLLTAISAIITYIVDGSTELLHIAPIMLSGTIIITIIMFLST